MITLSTGKTITPYGNTLGIDNELCLYEGYDGDLEDCEPDLTTEDKRAIAELMIDRWRRYLESLKEEPEK